MFLKSEEITTMSALKNIARLNRRRAYGQGRLVVVRSSGRLNVVLKNSAAEAVDFIARVRITDSVRIVGVL